jgi:hypothetical protein
VTEYFGSDSKKRLQYSKTISVINLLSSVLSLLMTSNYT